MKTPLISVIVPVYKVEAYLHQCVESIRSQTYSNLDIILVDDGSPDRCPEICDYYSSIDPRIRTIHQENRGLSGARNSGLKIAKGDYIAFVDSDDWLAPDCYSRCMEVVNRTSADIVCYDIFEVRGESIIHVPHMPFLSGDEQTFRAITNLTLLFSLWPLVWAKLYRWDWLLEKNMKFIEGMLYEDNPFVLGCWIRNPLVSILCEPLHYYRMQRPGQITSTGQPKTVDVFRMMEMVEHDFKHLGRQKDFVLLINWSVGNILWLYHMTPENLQKAFYIRMQQCFKHYLFLCLKSFYRPKAETLGKMFSVIFGKY